jgi:uncharacterized membrane protein YbhN (UPF0104 family)
MPSTPSTSALPAEPPAAAPAVGRARALFAVKLLVTGGALAFTFSRLSLADLAGAVGRLSLSAVLAAVALTLANLFVAGVRWRVLLLAHGAKDAPGVAFLWRAQLVGHFYNTFLPGNVTGDALRAHATRASFDGPLGSYMIVALERFFGLAGLFTVGAIGLLWHPLPGVMRADLLAAFAFATAFVIVLSPVLGRAFGRRLPGRAGAWAANLPTVVHPALLGVVLLLSLLTHTLVALTGHVLVHAVAPQVLVSESLVLVPLAMIATYVPFSVAGLGVREAAFVFLFGKVLVSAADATTASLAFMAVYVLVAALGGLLHLVRPLRTEPA